MIVETKFLYVAGSKSPFRCKECGSNCFTSLGVYRYSCNGCDARYVGESGEEWVDNPDEWYAREVERMKERAPA